MKLCSEVEEMGGVDGIGGRDGVDGAIKGSLVGGAVDVEGGNVCPPVCVCVYERERERKRERERERERESGG